VTLGNRRIAALCVVAALVSSACGSRLSDSTLATIDAAARGGGGVAAGATTGAQTTGGTGSATGVAGDTTGGTTPTGGSSTGTGATVPGAAPAGPNPAVAAQACGGGGATAKGVTANEIKVASIVTASGPLPGATEGNFRGAAAYIAKVNSEGGVCGRKITLLEGDDGLDPQRARGEFVRLEPSVFSFVGSLAVADSGYVDLVKSTKVPYVGTFVDPAGREAPNAFPRVAARVGYTGPYVYYRQKYPDANRAAFLFADVGGVRSNVPAALEPMKAAGFDVVYNSGAQATSPDYTADVINMRDKSVQFLFLFSFEINMHVRLARNMRQQNWEPTVKSGNIAYDSRLIDLLGGLSEGWTSAVTYLPVLNADEPAHSPAVAEFVKWNKQVFPSQKVDFFSVQGWSAAALFVTALKQVGADVTREKLLAVLEGIHSADGGGIVGRGDPAAGVNDGCFVITRVQGGQWVREYPAAGFECGMGSRINY
jgi:ABC-type branched-subunit amino acid transport system substrate-binding protein